MKFTSLVSLATFVTLAIAQGAPDPQVNTPSSLVTCQPSQLTFTGSHPPFFLSVIPAGNPSAPPLVDFGTVQSSPFTWVVNLGAGTAVNIHIKDQLGVDAFSGQVTIIAGSDTSCVGKPLSSASGGASTPALPGTGVPGPSPSGVPAPTPSSVPSSAPPASPSSSSSAASAPASVSPSKSSSAAPSTSPSNAAVANLPALGVAGVLGLVGAAVLA